MATGLNCCDGRAGGVVSGGAFGSSVCVNVPFERCDISEHSGNEFDGWQPLPAGKSLAVQLGIDPGPAGME